MPRRSRFAQWRLPIESALAGDDFVDRENERRRHSYFLGRVCVRSGLRELLDAPREVVEPLMHDGEFMTDGQVFVVVERCDAVLRSLVEDD